jgi:hypothetical protein
MLGFPSWIVGLCLAILVFSLLAFSSGSSVLAATEQIDMQRTRELRQKSQAGQTLTPEEQQYLERAQEMRRSGTDRRAPRDEQSRPALNRGELKATSSVGLVPLCDMTTEQYKGEDGGLYGAGSNIPPAEHTLAAEAQLALIRPLNAFGQLADDGTIVFVSISMSNATQEFSVFKEIADIDPQKSSKVTIVDCAQGGRAMAEWADPEAAAWNQAENRLQTAGVTPAQVQVAWVKLANKLPSGDLEEHGRQLEQDTLAVLQNAKTRFPNLRIAYLSSRVYGGYATTPLNPEPYAYEGAYPVRWLIQRQINGDEALNFNGAASEIKTPLLLWGPYLWADGVKPRKLDGLTWERADFIGDGTHPSDQGRQKVANFLLEFFTRDPLAQPWFAVLTSEVGDQTP